MIAYPRIEATSSELIAQISYTDLSELFGGVEDSDEIEPILERNTSKLGPLLHKIQSAFDRGALGFLEVTSLPPEMVKLRQKLLPKAENLANLPREELEALELPEKGYSFGWSHGKESFRVQNGETTKRRYDTAKGSFYFNPYANSENVYPSSLQPSFEDELLQMTRFMSKVGLWIAVLCDLYLGSLGKEDDLHEKDCTANFDIASSISSNPWMVYKSLKDGKPSAKARLLYYFPHHEQDEPLSNTDHVYDDWCGWHTDHGSLTALLPGMLTGTTDNRSVAIGPKPGLYIKTIGDNERLVHVDLAQDSLGFQLGETLEILSKGKFEATPHAVKASTVSRSIGRASLAVFLQPKASQVLPPMGSTGENSDELSLQNRWRSSFGEFQRVTIESFS